VFERGGSGYSLFSAELELSVERRVQSQIAVAQEKAKLEAEEPLRLRVLEREEQIASMQRQIDELKRKAEQGSQQLQGEVQEIELEGTLRAKFHAIQFSPSRRVSSVEISCGQSWDHRTSLAGLSSGNPSARNIGATAGL
jgi:hypothetical protein